MGNAVPQPANAVDSGDSERVVEPRERSNSLAAVTDIDVPHHERPRDAAEPHTVDMVKAIQGKRAGSREHPADIDEGSQLYVNDGRGGIEGQDFAAILQTAGKGIAIVETPGAKAAQRLFAADHTFASAKIAERPEWDVMRSR